MSNKRLPADTLQEDLEAFAGLLALEDYAPVNPQYALTAIKSIKEMMENYQTGETQKAAAAQAARDAAAATERQFHSMMIGVKTQVKAQYGENSNELQSLGLKKKSDYKPAKRKPKNNGSV